MKHSTLKKLLILPALLIAGSLFANNLQITNVNRLDNAGARDLIEFTLSWESSWNVKGSPANHDAIWVFIKFGGCSGGGTWSHLNLATTTGAKGLQSASGHTLSPGMAFAQDIKEADRLGRTNQGKHNTGVLLRRSSFGIGNMVSQVCTLKVLTTTPTGRFLDPTLDYDVKVIGIEMVQVTEGSFPLGGGVESYYPYHVPGMPSEVSLLVESNGAFDIQRDYFTSVMSIAANFPNGYEESYCMKYEITQGQYIDFLSAIPLPGARTFSYNNYGQHFVVNGGLVTTDAPNRAMAYCSALDMLAYLDWACLRPMTDMEYEKACFGPGGQGYAWGNGAMVRVTGVNYPAEGQMTASNTGANVNKGTLSIAGYPGPDSRGATEVGMFAREADETRASSGATYYGIMDMSGNAGEGCIHASTRSTVYTGVWGDGELSNTGNFNVADWVAVSNDASYGRTTEDIIVKGGYFDASGLNPYLVTDMGGAFQDMTSDTRSTDKTMRGVR